MKRIALVLLAILAMSGCDASTSPEAAPASNPPAPSPAATSATATLVPGLAEVSQACQATRSAIQVAADRSLPARQRLLRAQELAGRAQANLDAIPSDASSGLRVDSSSLAFALSLTQLQGDNTTALLAVFEERPTSDYRSICVKGYGAEPLA